MGNQVDVLFVGSNSEQTHIQRSCEDFGYSLSCIQRTEDILDLEIDPSLIILSEHPASGMTADELIQISRQNFKEAFLLLIVEKELTRQEFDKLSKYGADTIMLKSEIGSAKIGFSINQILQANHIAFKTTDLVPDRPIPFAIYHLLPTRKKFLKILREGDSISEARLRQMGESYELYFHRNEAITFKNFVEATADKSAKGLAKRCRANFMALRTEFTKLAFELSDQSNRVSFGQGQTLLKKCQLLCQDLLANLAEFPEAWKIINGSSVGEFGSLERAPTIASYSGVFALMMNLNHIEEIMLAALLVDVGSLALPVEISRKIRHEENLTKQDLQEIHAVPERSLSMALSRKLSLEERLRSILLGVNENADGSGFPYGVTDQKISLESQVIRLAKEFDAKTVLKFGKLKISAVEAMRQILSDKDFQKIFSKEFLSQTHLLNF